MRCQGATHLQHFAEHLFDCTSEVSDAHACVLSALEISHWVLVEWTYAERTVLTVTMLCVLHVVRGPSNKQGSDQAGKEASTVQQCMLFDKKALTTKEGRHPQSKSPQPKGTGKTHSSCQKTPAAPLTSTMAKV